jgi:hypothetical protein
MTIERHSRARQIELGKSIASRCKIYLDARFWIIVRDTALGVLTEPAARKLLHHLRHGVAGGRLVCPISSSMFLELMKQPYSSGRRIVTAEIIDELSLGVSMIPPQIIMGTEIHTFLLEAQGGAELHPIQELIWTKVAYVLGDTYPSLAQLPAAKELAIQKTFFDYLWGHSLSEMVKTISDKFSNGDGFVKLSRLTNEKNAQYKGELRSFAQTYDIELRGIIEVAGDMAADIVHGLAEKEAGCQLPSTSAERAASINACRNLLYHALKQPKTKDALRSLHIGASIHAAMRWDKKRQFKPNDYYDFEHATAALSYCDAFLTDGPLHDLVTRPQIKLSAVNGCHVFSDVSAAAEHIKELSSSR